MSDNTTGHFLRRICLDYMHPAELAIVNAIQEIEKMEADVELTASQTILQQARDRLADYLDVKHGKFTSLAAKSAAGSQVSAPFKVFINQKEYNLPSQYYSGKDIKNLSQAPLSHGVWVRDEKGDMEIADGETVDLKQPHRQHYFTGSKQTTEGCGVSAEAKEEEWQKKEKAYNEEIKRLKQSLLIARIAEGKSKLSPPKEEKEEWISVARIEEIWNKWALEGRMTKDLFMLAAQGIKPVHPSELIPPKQAEQNDKA